MKYLLLLLPFFLLSCKSAESSLIEDIKPRNFSKKSVVKLEDEYLFFIKRQLIHDKLALQLDTGMHYQKIDLNTKNKKFLYQRGLQEGYYIGVRTNALLDHYIVPLLYYKLKIKQEHFLEFEKGQNMG